MEEEVELLRRYKAKHLGKAVADVQLDAWDRLYYMAMAKARSLPFTQSLNALCLCQELTMKTQSSAACSNCLSGHKLWPCIPLPALQCQNILG